MPNERLPRAPIGHLLQNQWQHLLLLAVLWPGAWALAGFGDGASSSWAGLDAEQWLWLATGVAVLQQVGVVVVWRAQLCFHGLSRVLGRADLVVWGLFFLPLLVARPLLIAALGLADAGSLGWPLWLRGPAVLLLALPSLYAMYTVQRYFGIPRALGGDHFYERHRQAPLVKQGAFALTDNAMYGLAFLGLWAIALGLNSRAALAAAAFQHAYIWVHWFCTEAPDIHLLYGERSEPLSPASTDQAG